MFKGVTNFLKNRQTEKMSIDKSDYFPNFDNKSNLLKGLPIFLGINFTIKTWYSKCD